MTSEFEGASTTLGGATVNGKDVRAEAFDVLPSIYFSAPMSEKFVFGAYLNAPYATGTDFGDDSVRRYFATESSITGIDFGTALGFQGGSYHMTPALTLRTGLALDQTPIKDEQSKVDFAFDDYKALSFGLTYDINKDLAFDFGVQKTFKQT